MFINHTNHPVSHWSAEELAAAQAFGEVQDVPFPVVPAAWDEIAVRHLAETQGMRILAMQPAAVLCQGEFSYTYALTRWLQEHGVLVLTACSEREAVERMDASGAVHRMSVFRFVRFRNYL